LASRWSSFWKATASIRLVELGHAFGKQAQHQIAEGGRAQPLFKLRGRNH